MTKDFRFLILSLIQPLTPFRILPTASETPEIAPIIVSPAPIDRRKSGRTEFTISEL